MSAEHLKTESIAIGPEATLSVVATSGPEGFSEEFADSTYRTPAQSLRALKNGGDNPALYLVTKEPINVRPGQHAYLLEPNIGVGLLLPEKGIILPQARPEDAPALTDEGKIYSLMIARGALTGVLNMEARPFNKNGRNTLHEDAIKGIQAIDRELRILMTPTGANETKPQDRVKPEVVVKAAKAAAATMIIAGTVFGGQNEVHAEGVGTTPHTGDTTVQVYGAEQPQRGFDADAFIQTVLGTEYVVRGSEKPLVQEDEPTPIPPHIGPTAVALVNTNSLAEGAPEGEITIPTTPSFEIPLQTYTELVNQLGSGPLALEQYNQWLTENSINQEAVQNFISQVGSMEEYLNDAFSGPVLEGQIAFTVEDQEVHAAIYFLTKEDTTDLDGNLVPQGSGIMAVPTSEGGLRDIIILKPEGQEYSIRVAFADGPEGKSATLATVMQTEDGNKIVTGIQYFEGGNIRWLPTASATVLQGEINVRDKNQDPVSRAQGGTSFPIDPTRGSVTSEKAGGARLIAVKGPNGEELYIAQGGGYTSINGLLYPEAEIVRAPSSRPLTQREIEIYETTPRMEFPWPLKEDPDYRIPLGSDYSRMYPDDLRYNQMIEGGYFQADIRRFGADEEIMGAGLLLPELSVPPIGIEELNIGGQVYDAVFFNVATVNPNGDHILIKMYVDYVNGGRSQYREHYERYIERVMNSKEAVPISYFLIPNANPRNAWPEKEIDRFVVSVASQGIPIGWFAISALYEDSEN